MSMGMTFSMWKTIHLWGILCKKKKRILLKTSHFDHNKSRIKQKLHQHKSLLRKEKETRFAVIPYIFIEKVSQFELTKPP